MGPFQNCVRQLLNNHINLFLSDNSGNKLLFILEKKVFLAKEYLLHLINKCSSSSTASQLHCLHILFSTAVFGIVYLPLSISSLCALIRKLARVDRFDNSFILSKYFSCWNINLNLQYVRNLFFFFFFLLYLYYTCEQFTSGCQETSKVYKYLQ